MRRKDTSVHTEFHPTLTAFLFEVDDLYTLYGDEAVITSGSEVTARHGETSLHYATPAQAADLRSWDSGQGRARVPEPKVQVAALKELRDSFCTQYNIPAEWVEIILESDHIHIEYQPKRQYNLTGI